MGTWQGKITGITESVPSNVHAPIEMDRINRYFGAIDLDDVAYGNSTPNINTLTTFYSNKLALKSDNSIKVLKWTAPSLAYDITINFPSSLVSADGSLKSVFDNVVNQFLQPQQFDKELKLKPITTPANDATYGSLFSDSADSNKLKFKKPDNSIISFPESLGGSNTHVQYNDNGVLGGESVFVYNKTTDELTVPGITINENFILNGVLSPSQITSDQNNYNPADLAKASIVLLNLDAMRTITGIVPPSDSTVLTLINTSNYKLKLPKESASSTSTNRFDFFRDVVVMPKMSLTIWYDTVSDRWKQLNSMRDIIVFYKDTTDITKVNVSTEQTIFSISIPANYLTDKTMIRFTVIGEYLNNSGSTSDFKCNLELNSNSVFRDQAGSVPSGVDRRAWTFRCELFPENGSSSLQYAIGNFQLSEATTALHGWGDMNDDEIQSSTSFSGGSTEAATSSMTLSFKTQHSVANANTSVTVKGILVELIP